MKATDLYQSFWTEQDKLDQQFNTEAYALKVREQERQKKIGGAQVITKIEDKSTKFSNRPHKRVSPSLGYIGKVRALVRSGHISQQRADHLLRQH